MTHRFLIPSAFALAAVAALAGPASAAAPDGVDWHMTAAQIKSSCAAMIKQTDARVSAIVRARSARTFDTVVLPLENASSDLNDKLVYQTFAYYVATDKGVRDASSDCQNAVSAYLNEVTARPALEQAVAAADKSGTAKSVYDKKLTALWLTTLKRSGAGLAPAARAEFVSLSNQLSQLGIDFSTNLQNDKTTVTLTAAQTAGIPADIRQRTSASARCLVSS